MEVNVFEMVKKIIDLNWEKGCLNNLNVMGGGECLAVCLNSNRAGRGSKYFFPAQPCPATFNGMPLS